MAEMNIPSGLPKGTTLGVTALNSKGNATTLTNLSVNGTQYFLRTGKNGQEYVYNHTHIPMSQADQTALKAMLIHDHALMPDAQSVPAQYATQWNFQGPNDTFTSSNWNTTQNPVHRDPPILNPTKPVTN